MNWGNRFSLSYSLAALGVAVMVARAAEADDATQYTVFMRPANDASGAEGWVGDTIPFYKDGQFHIYYLHEKRPNGDAFHPWNQLTTTDFAEYQNLGESIGTGQTWQQDLALGTGSIVELNPLAASWSFDAPATPPTSSAPLYYDATQDIPLRWDGTTGAPTSTVGADAAALLTARVAPNRATRLYATQGSLEAAGSFSFSLMVNPYQVDAGVASKLALLGKESAAGASWGVELLNANSSGAAKLNFFVFDQDGAADVQSAIGSIPTETNNSADAWHHVAGTYNASTGALALYLDGVKTVKTSTGLLGRPAYDNGALSVGTRSGGFSLDGVVGGYDSLQLYRGVLSDSQVESIRQHPASTLALPSTYYAFYTGHNWMFPAQNKPREGVMLATSQDLQTWSKDSSFTTLTAPDSSIYDRNEFRDPYVFADPRTGGYTMLVSTRNKNNGDGLLAEYRSNDLRNWSLQPAPFVTLPGGPIPEVANVFEMGGRWYLTYSKPMSSAARGTYYRMSESPGGPWSAEIPFDGRGFFAGNTVADGDSRFITGWVYTRQGETNAGAWQWAGNLVVHQMTPLPDGRISLTAPAAVVERFSASENYSEISRFGAVVSSGQDFTLSGATASVNFAALPGAKKITGEVSFDSNTQDFGLTLGGSTNRIVFYPATDEIRYSNDIIVPVTLEANTTYSLTLLTEGTVSVLYIADPTGRSVAATMRNYTIQGNSWGLFSKGGQVAFTNVSLYGVGQPGDFNADGTVDGADVLRWQRGGSPNPLSGDDLAIWQLAFSDVNSTPAAFSIPEPATWGLIMLAGLALPAARRRRMSPA